MENKIEVKDLKIKLSGKEILHGLNMKIEEGKFIGIIGPNGSGKSTLLKAIYRILKPSGGSIFLNGENIKDLSYRDSAKEIGVVAQTNQVDFDFTVFEMVLMGRNPYKKNFESNSIEDLDLAKKSLEKLGMYEYKDRLFSSLSGGEQQRIILARALAQGTSCYILDEPTNHLDIKYQLDILELVKSLEVTSLVALHDLNLAAMYCDYIYVMKDGYIVDHGRPELLLTEEFIKRVYDVETEVEYDKKEDRLHIFYKRKV